MHKSYANTLFTFLTESAVQFSTVQYSSVNKGMSFLEVSSLLDPYIR